MNPSKFFKKREATQASAAGVIAMKHVLEYLCTWMLCTLKFWEQTVYKFLSLFLFLIIEMKKNPLITVRFVNIFCMYMCIIYR